MHGEVWEILIMKAIVMRCRLSASLPIILISSLVLKDYWNVCFAPPKKGSE